MSIANEIQRLQQAKQDIVDALKTKGINIPSGSTIDEFADEINPYWEECVPDTSVDWTAQYLTFKALESGTFKLSMPTGLTFTSISYSTDSGSTWTTTNYNSGSTLAITTPIITSGSTVLWKGVGNALASTASTTFSSIFSSTCKFTANGNIMSLLYGDNFSGQTDLTGKNYGFCYLFSKAAFLISAVNLKLLATILANGCYQNMFYGCSSLTTAPSILPATTLATNAYTNMFNGCTSLTIAPELPATTLATSAYTNMFEGCKSLTTAPELPATTLANNCYQYMFKNCESLTTAPELPATTLANYCYYMMFNGCKGLTTAPELPATALTSYCYQSMFLDCENLTTAPELPATTLATRCYYYMFANCKNLTTAPVLSATTLVDSCYGNMFSGCTSLTTAPELPATTLVNNCYQSMFYGCTSLTTAPELPATTLLSGCYNNMFNGCTSLNYIKAMFTTTPSTSYMQNWVYGVSTGGTFVMNSAATWSSTTSCGTSTYPCNWTLTKFDLVDLGLPSGTIWAKCNVGASSETDYGNFYQYGKGTSQYAATSGQSDYTGTENPLATSADTAAQVWGGSWHMPTSAQCQELIDNTTYTWETNFNGSGINGGKFTASNGNYIFIPAAGNWNTGSHNAEGSYGFVWSSSPRGYMNAYYLDLRSINKVVPYIYRYYGCSVRPVVG